MGVVLPFSKRAPALIAGQSRVDLHVWKRLSGIIVWRGTAIIGVQEFLGNAVAARGRPRQLADERRCRLITFDHRRAG